MIDVAKVKLLHVFLHSFGQRYAIKPYPLILYVKFRIRVRILFDVFEPEIPFEHRFYGTKKNISLSKSTCIYILIFYFRIYLINNRFYILTQ